LTEGGCKPLSASSPLTATRSLSSSVRPCRRLHSHGILLISPTCTPRPTLPTSRLTPTQSRRRAPQHQALLLFSFRRPVLPSTISRPRPDLFLSSRTTALQRQHVSFHFSSTREHGLFPSNARLFSGFLNARSRRPRGRRPAALFQGERKGTGGPFQAGVGRLGGRRRSGGSEHEGGGGDGQGGLG
jgi:hypothetical protein